MLFSNSVDIIDLNAALGAYCRKDGAYVVKQVFNDLDSFAHIQVFDKVKDELTMIKPQIGNVVQKGESGRFNPPKNFTFEANILKVRPWKVDYAIQPLELHASYLAMRESAGSNFAQSVLFNEFIVTMVAKMAKANIELAIWQGTFDPAAAADGIANPLMVCDGVLRLITNNLAKCNQITTGAISDVNAVNAFEALWFEVPTSLRQAGMKLYCSERSWDMYKKNYRALYQTLPYNDKYDKVYLDASGTLLEIVPVRAMGDSNRLIIDSCNALALGTDLGLDMTRIITDPEVKSRSINLIMDGKIGVGVSAWTAEGTTKLITINDAA